jgi:hypothetical protein
MSIDVKFDDLHREIKFELEAANKSVSIAVAWINFKMYFDTFKDLIDRGVVVNILCTKHSSNLKQIDLINELREHGVQIRLYEMPRQTNHMHHKFAIIDESIIINGSFNWSKNAVTSFENLTIIKNSPNVASSFIKEFEKVENLDKNAIKSLQAANNCKEKGCDGKVSNLLVFQSSPMNMTYEIWGDVIKCCSVCGEDSFTTIKSAVQDTQLHSFLSNDELDFDDEEQLQFTRQSDSYLTGYSQHGVTIHGIGFVCRELRWNDEDIFTNIVWKNKFVAENVRDRYETNFNVFYE